MEPLVEAINKFFLYPAANIPLEPSIEECTERTFENFVSLYGLQIVFSVIYASFTDICKRKYLFDCLNIFLGLLYLLLIDMYKIPYLLCFFAASFIYCLIINHVSTQLDQSFPAHVYAFTCVFVALYLEYHEMYQLELKAHKWMLLIAMMKITSTAEHSDDSLIDDFFSVAFFGFLLSPVHVLYGPWVPIESYNAVYYRSRDYRTEWTIRKVWNILKLIFYSYCFYQVANCALPAFINNNFKFWILLYRRSLCMRFNYYAKTYIASASLIAGGYNLSILSSCYTISNPVAAEIPRSIETMAQNFDKQMYSFYSLFLSKFTNNYGPVHLICAINIYLILCFQDTPLDFYVGFTTLLVSIPAQCKFQEALADLISACVRSTPCFYCKHFHQSGSTVANALLTFFSVVNVILITYPFVYMDSGPLYNEMGEEMDTSAKKANLVGYLGVHLMILLVFSGILFNLEITGARLHSTLSETRFSLKQAAASFTFNKLNLSKRNQILRMKY